VITQKKNTHKYKEFKYNNNNNNNRDNGTETQTLLIFASYVPHPSQSHSRLCIHSSTHVTSFPIPSSSWVLDGSPNPMDVSSRFGKVRMFLRIVSIPIIMAWKTGIFCVLNCILRDTRIELFKTHITGRIVIPFPVPVLPQWWRREELFPLPIIAPRWSNQ